MVLLLIIQKKLIKDVYKIKHSKDEPIMTVK